MTDDFDIRHEREYYEVYVNGVFYCSADTLSEANHEIDTYIENQKEREQQNWDRAVKHVREVLYDKYSPDYYKLCSGLIERYRSGDRSQDLYERMIAIQ